MKTIATAAAAIVMLSASAWADEPESKAATADEPIVLSEAEMDGVTAGAWYAKFDGVDGASQPSSSGKYVPQNTLRFAWWGAEE